MNQSLSILVRHNVIGEIDRHFSDFIADLAGSEDPAILLGAALASRATTEGHLYLSLEEWGSRILCEESETGRIVKCPPMEEWIEILERCPAVGKTGDRRPLILDSGHRLYLYRYWEYEHSLSEQLLNRIHADAQDVDPERLAHCLDRLFPAEGRSGTDWQKVAAATACMHRFSVITGGPGTGKTTTLARMLAAMVEVGLSEKERICLTAPTGKAAARIGDAVRNAKSRMNTDEEIKARIPNEAKTIHRLLGAVSGSPYFRHTAENPVSVDILVVDEASMLDVPLASKLLSALPATARVILTGDENQLASVAPGAVLGDICQGVRSGGFSDEFVRKIRTATGEDIGNGTAGDGRTHRDHWIRLKRSFRFSEDGAIEALSRAVNEGRSEDALALMMDDTTSALSWQDMEDAARLNGVLEKTAASAFAGVLAADGPEAALERMEAFRILCAVNEGPFGVRRVNGLTENLLSGHPKRHGDGWYRGRPVLVLNNDYGQGLFNGDMGISWPDAAGGKNRFSVFFNTAGGYRKIAPIRLPAHETAFAVSVHKSQGSEFDHVLLILPETESPVLTRELIYTAVTRAKQSVTICGKKEIFRYALSRRIVRGSGLKDALIKR